MPRVRFIQPDGTSSDVQALSGDSIMETAIDNDVDGIVAECGGACSCATCHVYVEDEWLGKLPQPDALEDGMLDCVIDRRPNSRLSCQIRVSDEIDGITVHVPESQI
jgi:ferredoxin, 2Fe-2S